MTDQRDDGSFRFPLGPREKPDTSYCISGGVIGASSSLRVAETYKPAAK
jgi:hypothetical protein